MQALKFFSFAKTKLDTLPLISMLLASKTSIKIGAYPSFSLNSFSVRSQASLAASAL